MSDIPDMDKFLDTVESQEINDIVGAVLAEGELDIKTEVRKQLPYMRRASINDIVPEEYQQKLMEIDITMTQCYWLIGDICVDLVRSVNRKRAQEMGKYISKVDIFGAVGYFCHRTARSVRYYYECAWYFPVEVRKKYDVPFNIYAEARWVKDWELLLKIAEENPQWSAEHVRAYYYEQIGEDPPRRPKHETVNIGTETETSELPMPEGEEEWRGQAQARFKSVLLSKLDHTVDDLRGVLDRIPLPTELRVRIGEVILEIQDIGMQIRREG